MCVKLACVYVLQPGLILDIFKDTTEETPPFLANFPLYFLLFCSFSLCAEDLSHTGHAVPFPHHAFVLLQRCKRAIYRFGVW